MKKQIKKTALIFSLVLSTGIASAQVRAQNNIPPQPPAGGPGEIPAPPRPGKHPGGPERGGELKVLTTLTGKITDYTINDRYVYNGFTIQSGNKVTAVNFPERLGEQLMKTAKKGETITVKGFADAGPDGKSSFHLINATAGGIQIVETLPALPIQPVTTEPKTYTGTISELKKDERGSINGLNLNNKILIELPPHASLQLQNLLKTGDKIEVSGFKDTPPEGVALAANAPIMVHPQTITLRGQTYLLR